MVVVATMVVTTVVVATMAVAATTTGIVAVGATTVVGATDFSANKKNTMKKKMPNLILAFFLGI